MFVTPSDKQRSQFRKSVIKSMNENLNLLEKTSNPTDRSNMLSKVRVEIELIGESFARDMEEKWLIAYGVVDMLADELDGKK